MSAPDRVSRVRCFGGQQDVYEHDARVLGGRARFAVYLPPAAELRPCPVVYWLSGLTCTEQNFITKAGAQRAAAELGLVIVCPDTSPRGEGVPNDAGYDLGQGAGFYLNATESPWSTHYQMYDYVVEELPALVRAHLPVNDAMSIFGHSMGGHGALVAALRNPGRYRSVSAFSPIVNPIAVPWGQKAFRAYLGTDEARWQDYDAVTLVARATERLPLFIDQGTADEFLESQLRPERLEAACAAVSHPINVRRQIGYDHSYYFIASFIEDHLRHHAAALSSAD